jgi:hypothetical protein
VIGEPFRLVRALAGKRRKETTMSLRSLAILAFLIMLQLAACGTSSRQSTAIDEMERRHDETTRMLGGGGGGSGM